MYGFSGIEKLRDAIYKLEEEIPHETNTPTIDKKKKLLKIITKAFKEYLE